MKGGGTWSVGSRHSNTGGGMFGFVWQELRSRYTVCTQRESLSSIHALTLMFESSWHSTRAISNVVVKLRHVSWGLNGSVDG